MKKLIAAVAIVVPIMVIIYCLHGSEEKSPRQVENERIVAKRMKALEKYQEEPASASITIGNHSYIPLNIQESPAFCPKEILAALKNFEETHSDLEITNWKVQEHGGGWGTMTYGLWIDHKKKQPKE